MVCFCARIVRAAASFSAVTRLGRPESRPRAGGGQAGAGALSDDFLLEFGRAPKMWSCRRPAEVVVSICSVSKKRNPISRSCRSSIASIRCLRPSRSRRQTTSVSPALRAEAGRRARSDASGTRSRHRETRAGSLLERIELQREALIVRGHARVARIRCPLAARLRLARLRAFAGPPGFCLGEPTWSIVSEVSDATVAAGADHETGF